MAQPNWNTAAGSLGTFPASIEVTPIQLSASPVLPAITITYNIISGVLPTGMYMTDEGVIFGTPAAVPDNSAYTIVVRVTDNLGNIRDRTFIVNVTGVQSPKFVTPSGVLFSQLDSVWVEFPIQFSNPISTNPVLVNLAQGNLPPGLEINEYGLIRGYPAPPFTNNVAVSEYCCYCY